jgi:5'-nucleotidase
MPLIRGLLSINPPGIPERDRLVEVILLSRNDADSAMRLFNSIDAYGLGIHRGALTSGRDPWPYLGALQCSLFLSTSPDDVFHARAGGFPAALVLPRPGESLDADPSEVRIAFDGDAVLFHESSELMFQRDGLEAFQDNERLLSDLPLDPGPFAPFLLALKRIQDTFPEGKSPIRTALVTARGAPTHTRVIKTLRAWGVRMDETFFLGGIAKAPVLEALRPHIFFDDQLDHLREAQLRVPSAHVVAERQQLALFAEETLATGPGSAPLIVMPAVRPATTTPPAQPAEAEPASAAGQLELTVPR